MKKFPYFLILGGLGLGACSSDKDVYKEEPVEVLYNTAMDSFESNAYQAAASEFEEVDRQHPYSKWAAKAQIMGAYSHYKAQKYERAIAALEAFRQLHPAHEDVPYSLYLEALSYYEQISPVLRDPLETEKALELFKDLNRRYPLTDYAKDARLKINLLEDAIAGKEMEIGRFYQDKRNYAAAKNRFQAVIKQYDTTKHIEEALYRTIECCLALNLREEAKDTAAVLGHNYPSSPWYAEAYRLLGEGPLPDVPSIRDKDESWIDRLRNWNKGLPKTQETAAQAPTKG